MSLSQDCVHSPLLSLSAPHFVSHDDRGLCLPGASLRLGPPMSVMMVSGPSLSLSPCHTIIISLTLAQTQAPPSLTLTLETHYHMSPAPGELLR